MAEGMPRAEASAAARREFGNVALMEERSREAWQWTGLESALSDARFALRRLRKAPGFAVTILLTLAIGIGANTAVFSVVNSVLLKPLAYPDSGRLVSLHLDAPGMGGLSSTSDGLRLSESMYMTFSRHSQSFDSMGIWTSANANVTGLAQPDEVDAIIVSSGVLETLDVPALLGRWFMPAEQDPRGAKAVVLGYAYWQKRFGGDRGVIGRSLQVDGVTRTIVGVMPKDLHIEDDRFDLIVPMAVEQTNLKLAGFGLVGIGRLKQGVTIAQANADISRLIGVWMNEWTNGPGSNPHYYEVWRITPHFISLKQAVVGDIGSVLWVVMATVGLVMLIACVNVANLLMVRTEARQQELSIRAALGAGRGRIARELLIESVMLGLLGGVLSIGVAVAGLRLLVALGPTDLPRLSEVGFDAGSFGFTFALAVFSGLLFGSIPALKYAGARTTAMMGGTMSSSGRTASAGRARQRSRNVMVVAQVAMALVLLVCSVLMIRTFMASAKCGSRFQRPQRIFENAEYLHAGAGGAGPAHGGSDAAGDCGQVGGDSGSGFGGLCRHCADGWSRWELGHCCRGRQGVSGWRRTTRALQLCFAGILSDAGHAPGGGTRLYMGRPGRRAAKDHGLRELCARKLGFCRRGDRQAHEEVR